MGGGAGLVMGAGRQFGGHRACIICVALEINRSPANFCLLSSLCLVNRFEVAGHLSDRRIGGVGVCRPLCARFS